MRRKVERNLRELESDLRLLATSLVGRAAESSEEEAGTSFNERIESSVDLAKHGEPGVGFENLVSNVYEFGVEITRSEYEAFQRLGQSLRLDPTEWSDLEALVRKDAAP